MSEKINHMKKLFILVGIIFAVYLDVNQNGPGLFHRDVPIAKVAESGKTPLPESSSNNTSTVNQSTNHLSRGNAETSGSNTLFEAISKHTSGVQVTGYGTVMKILPDDNEGSRHQRFIIRIESGHSVRI